MKKGTYVAGGLGGVAGGSLCYYIVDTFLKMSIENPPLYGKVLNPELLAGISPLVTAVGTGAGIVIGAAFAISLKGIYEM